MMHLIKSLYQISKWQKPSLCLSGNITERDLLRLLSQSYQAALLNGLSGSSKFPDVDLGTYRDAPVNLGDLDVKVQAEEQKENARHHEGTAADKLEEVDPSTDRAHHDGLYADETDEWEDLKWRGRESKVWKVGLAV